MKKTVFFFSFVTICLLINHKGIGQTKELNDVKKQMTSSKDSNQFVDLLNKAGFLLHMQSSDSTFKYAIRSLKIAERLGYLKGKGDAYSNLGAGLMLKGLYGQALKYYSKSYSTYQAGRDTANMMQSLINQAIAYDFIGDSIKRKDFSTRSLKFAAAIPNDSVTSMIYLNYASLNPELSADSVDLLSKKAKKIAEHFHDERALLVIYQVEANSLLGEKKNHEAKKIIDKIERIATNYHWDYHYLEGLGLKARYFQKLGNIDSAIITYKAIYKKAIANHFSFWETEVLNNLITCYKLKNDHSQLLKYNELLVRSLQKENSNIKDFTGDYLKYTLVEEDGKKLALINATNAAKIRWLIGTTIIGVTLLCILVFLYRRSKRFGEVLEVNNAFKSQLISVLAHDFRSPLSSTLGMIELMRDDSLSADDTSNLLGVLEEEIYSVLLTFDNLLRWIKEQAAGYTYKPQQIQLAELWKEVFIFFNAAIEKKNIKITLLIPEKYTVVTDKEILLFVNRNLIHNAIKYSPVGGEIIISTAIQKNKVTTSIKDQGPGMSEKQLRNLFSFTKDMASSTENGAGMAMAICKEFLDKVGGTIWAESNLGDGTTFVYTFEMM